MTLRSGAPAIDARGLEKSYGATPVLRGVDLHVPPGRVVALLGSNGAGKTTTVRILTTLTRADGGTAEVAGFDVVTERRHVRRAIRLTGQYAALDGLQTGVENLRMIGQLSGMTRRAARRNAADVLDRFGLTDAGDRLVKTYSGGMRRRLDLAASLIGRPQVIFLDEPTTGLDPRSRRDVWATVADLARSGVTIFLTTQYLEEADELADRVAVIHGGRIAAEGTPAELKARVGGHRLDLTVADDTTFDVMSEVLGQRLVQADRDGRSIGVDTDGTAAHVRAVLDELDPDRDRIAQFAVRTATLDDVFFALTTEADPVQPNPPLDDHRSEFAHV